MRLAQDETSIKDTWAFRGNCGLDTFLKGSRNGIQSTRNQSTPREGGAGGADASSVFDTAFEGASDNVCEHGNPSDQCQICKGEAVLPSSSANNVERARLAYERARKGIEAARRAINQAEMMRAAKEVVQARTEISKLKGKESMRNADLETKRAVDNYLRLTHDETSISHNLHLRGGRGLACFVKKKQISNQIRR
jgi:hypothetical protein